MQFFTLFTVLLSITSCKLRSFGNGEDNGVAQLTDIKIKPLDAEKLPWNDAYKARTASERKSVADRMNGFALSLSGDKSKCKNADLKVVTQKTEIKGTSVTRGCKYDVTFDSGPLNQDKTKLDKVWIEVKSQKMSYTVPTGTEAAIIKLTLCPTKEAEEFFDASACVSTTTVDPNKNDTDATIDPVIVSKAKFVNLSFKLDSSGDECVVEKCSALTEEEAKKVLISRVGRVIVGTECKSFMVEHSSCAAFVVGKKIPASFKEFQAEGTLVDLGFRIKKVPLLHTESETVLTVIPNSPADKAGLGVGMKIKKVEGRDIIAGRRVKDLYKDSVAFTVKYILKSETYVDFSIVVDDLDGNEKTLKLEIVTGLPELKSIEELENPETDTDFE